jgi:hypothetical protein
VPGVAMGVFPRAVVARASTLVSPTSGPISGICNLASGAAGLALAPAVRPGTRGGAPEPLSRSPGRGGRWVDRRVRGEIDNRIELGWLFRFAIRLHMRSLPVWFELSRFYYSCSV